MNSTWQGALCNTCPGLHRRAALRTAINCKRTIRCTASGSWQKSHILPAGHVTCRLEGKARHCKWQHSHSSLHERTRLQSSANGQTASNSFEPGTGESDQQHRSSDGQARSSSASPSIVVSDVTTLEQGRASQADELATAATDASASAAGEAQEDTSALAPASALESYLCIMSNTVLWTGQLFWDAVRNPLMPRTARLMNLRLAAHVEPGNADKCVAATSPAYRNAPVAMLGIAEAVRRPRRFAELASALNRAGQGKELVELVDSRRFSLNNASAAEYLQAMSASGRLSRLAEGGAVQ